MHVMIMGATGFIGSSLVGELQKQRCEISAGVRDVSLIAARFPRVNAIPLDVTKPPGLDDWVRHLKGVDVVINTIGIIAEVGEQTFKKLHIEFPCELFKACELAGVRRVIQVSALGAEAGASSQYHLSKFAADTHLREYSMEKIIVKPSLIYDAGGKSAEFFKALAAQPLQVLIDDGQQQVQPIHIDDLTTILVALVMNKNPPDEIYAVGPTPLTFKDMLAGYRQWLGYDPAGSGALRSISLPYWFILSIATLLSYFFKNPYMNADNIRMLQQGNSADSSTITSLLGSPPVTFQAGLSKTLATDADRWHASLYFLLPLLRWAIAFIWIYTGVISAFVYPQSESYLLLQEIGLAGWMLPLCLYGAASLDIALGVAVMLRYRIHLIGLIQVTIIFAYTVIISIFLPEFWFHPFGPIIKNIPFLLMILVMTAVERK